MSELNTEFVLARKCRTHEHRNNSIRINRLSKRSSILYHETLAVLIWQVVQQNESLKPLRV